MSLARVSLRVRVVLLVLFAIAPAMLLLFYNARQQRDAAAAAVKLEALNLARSVSGQQDDVIVGTQQMLSAVAQIPSVRALDGPTCSLLLADIHAQFPRYANIAAEGADGVIACSALASGVGFNNANYDWYQRALQAPGFHVGTYVWGTLTGKSVLTLADSLADENGRVATVVFASLDLGWLNAALQQAELPANASVVVIDGNGTVLAQQPAHGAIVGKPLPDGALRQTLLSGGQGTLNARDIDGQQRLFAYAPLGANTGVSLAIGVPMASAYAAVDRALLMNLIALGTVAALALVAAWFGGERFVLRPLRTLVAVAERLRRGDLDARTGYAGAGEFDRLGSAVDAMADALQRRDAELRRLALHDPLTGLPNRALFADRLGQALRAAKRANGTFAILSMDLDGFKAVNDERGHETGDALLCAIAARLPAVLRASDTVARVGGDEFVALLPQTDADGARAAAQKLLGAITAPIDLPGGPLTIGCSIGLACYPADGENAEALLRRADSAMYVEKRSRHAAAEVIAVD